MSPNFIIGGATASGTSFLTHLLMQHEDIYMPKDMYAEPHFFSLSSRYQKGIESYQKTWFSEYEGQKAIGERSSTYFHFPDSAERLKTHFPTIKLIFVLRNPIERAWAHYRYMILRGIEELDFKTALSLEKSRILDELKNGIEKRHHEYMGRSLYGQQLERFLNFFPWDQILIINSENLRNQTETQLRKITNFLGIKPLNSPKIVSDFTSLSVKNPKIQAEARLHFGSKKSRYLIEAIRHKQENLSCFVENEEDIHFISLIRNNLCQVKEELSAEIRTILHNQFKEDQINFFDLAKSKIDFTSWE